ncbi:BCCT transporter [Deltaproteobacteria bacterium Smac51]|nr:BCCT transporter [Deltaproteobacteria bacterium Smac51]
MIIASRPRGEDLMSGQKTKLQLRWGVILFTTIIMGSALIMGFVDPKGFNEFFTGIFLALLKNGGWFVLLATLLFLTFMVFLLIHPAGKIRFGGEEAKPEFSLWEWFSISMCAGVGVGLLMWPGAETIYLIVTPAVSAGLESGSQAAAVWALAKVFLHWTFAPYAIYIVSGIVIGYAYYNLGRGFTVGAGLYPLMGPAAERRFGGVIDAITVFAVVGGIAGTFGYGILQIGSGLDYVFGLTPSVTVWIAICAAIVMAYVASSISGIYRGIRRLSTLNMYLFVFLLAFALIFGPTAFMLNMTTESLGFFVNNFITLSTFTDPFQNDLWPQWWDMYWFVDWASFAPILGVFLARAAYGRTIRQFVRYNFILPALFGLLWFGVFGSFTIYLELTKGAGLGELMTAKGMEVVTLRLLDFLPLVDIIRPLFLITLCISFITLADSMTSTIASLSLVKDTTSRREVEAPTILKLFWGVIIGATSLVYMINGGIDGLKVVKTIAGFPIIFLETAMIIGFVGYFINQRKPLFEGFSLKAYLERERRERQELKALRDAAISAADEARRSN